MRNIVKSIMGSILRIILVVVISLLAFLSLLMYQEKTNYNNLYKEEIYAELSTFNSKDYEDIMSDIDNIKGVTVSNARISDSTDDVVYVDEVYYNKIKADLTVVEGKGFSSEDFIRIYDGSEPLPLIITEDYAKENKLHVGDEVLIEDTLPSICGLYTTWSGMMGGDEGTVTVEYPAPEKQCDDLGQFEKVHTKVQGIISEEKIPLVGGKEIENPRILPTYIVEDENMQLYNLESYMNHEPIYTNIMYNQWIFIDYSVISPQEFQKEFEEIEEKYSTPIDIYSEILNEGIQLQTEIQQKMQIEISFIYIFLIVMILYISYTLNKLKYKEYKFSIYHLLGVQWKTITMIEIKKNIIYFLIELSVINLILYFINMLSMFRIAIFVLITIYLIECIIIIIKYKLMLNKELNENYIKGEA